MKILLLGYGKMGRSVEKAALLRGHEISCRIQADNQADKELVSLKNTDIAIEFSQPESAAENLRFCLEKQIPVVCGTTGWLSQKAEIEQLCIEKNGAFFYASNFSIGVNLFFRLNQMLAELMKTQFQYEALLTEIHHVHKKDAPSGTALTLAEGIQNTVPTLQNKLVIESLREGEVPGTHIVRYESAEDVIEIRHEALSRDGFAIGAVLAAEWLLGRKGVFGMEDLLRLKD
jgi:4-hydroxy-tetrahydrodipicolinate reductase